MKGSATNTDGTKISSNKKPIVSDNAANVGIPLLSEGAYSEAESHEGFLNALNAWRDAGKPDEEKKTPSSNKSKKVKFSEIEQAWAHQ